jgi:hypothetical protein
MLRNYSFWRLPFVELVFQRHRNDGITWRHFDVVGLPVRLSLSAAAWTRAAFYDPCEEQRRGHWARWKQTLSKGTWHAVRHGTGLMMAAYCADRPKVWGGIGLSFPRLNVFLVWESRSWRRKVQQHDAGPPCRACAEAGWTQWSSVCATRWAWAHEQVPVVPPSERAT